MSDLISRADAIERIANDNVVGGMKRINEYRDSTEHNDYLDAISAAIATVEDIPSADAVTHEIRTETHDVCLISKDDAMGAVQDHFNANGFKGYDDGQKMMDRIKALPSAELTKGELISRADAIDALCHNCAYYTDAQCKTDSGYWCESGAMIREAIPSAEAEKTYIGIDIPYGSDKGIAALFKGKDDKLILEEVKEIMAVVRCKDCKHYIVEGITTQYGWCHEYKHSVNEDDYCSYGERRKE